MENTKDKIIESISDRINSENYKHSSLDWQKIAACKIYSQWIEPKEKETRSQLDKKYCEGFERATLKLNPEIERLKTVTCEVIHEKDKYRKIIDEIQSKDSETISLLAERIKDLEDELLANKGYQETWKKMYDEKQVYWMKLEKQLYDLKTEKLKESEQYFFELNEKEVKIAVLEKGISDVIDKWRVGDKFDVATMLELILVTR